MDVRVGLWRKLSADELMLLNCGVREDSWESLGLQGDPTSPSWRRSVLGVHWKDWCWSWNSTTLATLWEELTYLKRPWCWERFRAEREGDDRGWDGWMASPTKWTWVWVDSGSWWWTRRPGMLQFTGSQRVRYNWTTELKCQIPEKEIYVVLLYFFNGYLAFLGFPGSTAGKESVFKAGDLGSIPGLGRPPGGGLGNPLHYSFLGIPMDRGAWWATVHGIAKSRTQLSD